jgi:hypothetical protein
MKIKAAFSSLALLASVASAAQAATTLVTPPYDFLSKHDLFCTVRNIGTKGSVDVRIEARGDAGDVKNASVATIGPGQASAHFASIGQSSYCAFVVLSGSKKNLRASALLSDPFDDDHYIAAIPAE